MPGNPTRELAQFLQIEFFVVNNMALSRNRLYRTPRGITSFMCPETTLC
jgi:hypothetical protein